MEPERYEILKANDAVQGAGEKTEEYYPGPEASYVPTFAAYREHKPSYYQNDRKPYYGLDTTMRKLEERDPSKKVVNVILQDLDDYEVSNDNLQRLIKKKHAIENYIPSPKDLIHGNEGRLPYEKDPGPYYDPFIVDKVNALTSIDGKINFVLRQMNQTDLEFPLKLSKVNPKRGYQNSVNANIEKTNNVIKNEYYYNVSHPDVGTNSEPEKKSSDSKNDTKSNQTNSNEISADDQAIDPTLKVDKSKNITNDNNKSSSNASNQQNSNQTNPKDSNTSTTNGVQATVPTSPQTGEAAKDNSDAQTGEKPIPTIQTKTTETQESSLKRRFLNKDFGEGVKHRTVKIFRRNQNLR